MPNPYHDSQGRFTSREDQLALIQDALDRKDINTYLAEKAAFEEVEKAKVVSYNEEIFTPQMMKFINKDIEKRDQLLSENNYNNLKEFLEERSQRQEYLTALQYRNELLEEQDKLKSQYDLYKRAWDEGAIEDYEIVRQKGFEVLNNTEDLMMIKKQLGEYKDVNSVIVARLAELKEQELREKGLWHEYEEETLNGLVATGNFETGSREWLEQRQKGIGGSDIGDIVKADPDYGRENYKKVLEDKVNPITDEMVAEQAESHENFADAVGRGSAWEPYIAQKFAENNPDIVIAHCKTSWKNSEKEYQFANFDGLMLDENGHPDGILEIKTGADPTKWGDPADGLDAIPPQYKAQVLWYADAAGFKRGAVAAIIDDNDYREYHFEMTPKLQEEVASYHAQAQEFLNTVEKYKKGFRPAPRIRRGFPVSWKKELEKETGPSMKIFEEAALFRGESVYDVRERYIENFARTNDSLTAMKLTYVENLPDTTTPIVALDLETSGEAPTRGHIIEVGYSVRDEQGKEQKSFSSLFGLSQKALNTKGTGMVSVHNITPEMVKGKKPFTDPKVQKEILNDLRGKTLMVHNAVFERGWLRQHLKGFANAERAGEIKIIDTMRLSEHLVDDTPNNKLESFAPRFGVPYENAHRAKQDADMMYQAFHNMRKEIQTETNNWTL